MCSENLSQPKPGKAETAFRAAFQRLKANTPSVLPKGTAVTQNNVAREAGVDPSALKKNRFPLLIIEIKCWINENTRQPHNSPRQQIVSSRSRIRELQQKLELLKIQRDHALSLLVDADNLIVDLTLENSRLKKQLPVAKITPLFNSAPTDD